jgi:hypothetical protein
MSPVHTPEGERGNDRKKRFLPFSLLSLWERRAGEVRAGGGDTASRIYTV